MTSDDEARAWAREQVGVSRETELASFVDMVRDEAANQNLVSASTLEAIWLRHIADSVQLLPLAAEQPGAWLDIGTGAGFPGMVVAILREEPTWLIEPRRRRATFLRDCAERLGIANRVHVIERKVERVTEVRPSIISARAVAALSPLIASAYPVSNPDTLWLLPKGRSADAEVAEARKAWHGVFRTVPSVTDPEAQIVTLRQARPR